MSSKNRERRAKAGAGKGGEAGKDALGFDLKTRLTKVLSFYDLERGAGSRMMQEARKILKEVPDESLGDIEIWDWARECGTAILQLFTERVAQASLEGGKRLRETVFKFCYESRPGGGDFDSVITSMWSNLLVMDGLPTLGNTYRQKLLEYVRRDQQTPSAIIEKEGAISLLVGDKETEEEVLIQLIKHEKNSELAYCFRHGNAQEGFLKELFNIGISDIGAAGLVRSSKRSLVDKYFQKIVEARKGQPGCNFG